MLSDYAPLVYGSKPLVSRHFRFVIFGRWQVLYLKWATTWQNQQCGCAPSEDSDQLGHPPSLSRVFAVRSVDSQGRTVSSCGQRRLWSDWADAQADLSLRWAHTHFVGFVMLRHINMGVSDVNSRGICYRGCFETHGCENRCKSYSKDWYLHVCTCILNNKNYWSHVMRKPRSLISASVASAQSDQRQCRIRAVRSAPLLFAAWKA